MAELLAQSERESKAMRPLRSGETVEGTVASIDGDARAATELSVGDVLESW